uniref:BSD domain-containing protein n=1 Tax=Aegilops tauschii subsp. strangulata TaxID=200361 RepID=A0A453FL31_AEGTS
MSWLARSIAATLSSAPDDDDDDHSEAASGHTSPDHAANADAEEDEQPDTPGRGVKGDISELTESLTRRFWGVASFLAPPPPAGAEAETLTAAAEAEAEGEYGPQSPRVAGIRNDLAEIGGRVRSGISMLSNANAVAEISKIASSFLPFVPEEEEEEVDAVGVTEEVVVFVRHISTSPETWLDFPLFVNDRHADDFELSDTQYEHALAIERIVPSLSYLRTELCSTNMSEACFWKIYFVLLHSKLNKENAEVLSTTQILEAREELLQSSPRMKNVASEDIEFSPSSIQDKSGIAEATSFQEPTPDPLPGAEADKHPISTSEPEIIDKSVIEEELVVKTEIKNPGDKPNLYTPEDGDDKEVEDWLEDMDHADNKTGNITSVGQDEDVSFSDLEDEDDD